MSTKLHNAGYVYGRRDIRNAYYDGLSAAWNMAKFLLVPGDDRATEEERKKYCTGDPSLWKPEDLFRYVSDIQQGRT